MTPRVQTENRSIIQVTERAESEVWWGSCQEGEERRSGRHLGMQNISRNDNL